MKSSVLIVDDNEADRCYTALMLERSGRWGAIREAASGEEALRMLLGEPGEVGHPTLVLLDINMPRMNGFEFLDALSKHENDVRLLHVAVVMLTSSDNDEDASRARTYPIVRGFETKPMNEGRAVMLAELLRDPEVHRLP